MDGGSNWSLFLPIGIAAVTALSLGYDEGVMSGAGAPMAKYFKLGAWETGLMMGILNVIAAPGALLGSVVADALGRVRSVAITAIVLIAGPIVVSFSDSFAVLMFGRVLTGLGVGFAFVVPPLYASELSPPKLRGRLVTLTEVMICVGLVFGYLSAFIFDMKSWSPEVSWRFVYGLAMIPPLLVLVCTPLMPESPRWLAKQNRWEEAEVSLERICSDAEEARMAKDLLRQALQDESSELGWSEVLCPTPRIRRMLCAGLGIAFFQQACGSESMIYYSPLILDRFGVDKGTHQTFDTLLVGFAKLAGGLLGGPFLDFVGRRPGVITSSGGCGIALALMALLVGVNIPAIGVLLICGFMVFFELGLAPCAFVVGTESYPVQIRAKALSLGMFTTRLISGLVSMFFPKMCEALTMKGTLGTYALISFIGVAWMVMYVPETKGLPLEEVVQLFDDEPKLLSARDDSANYKTL
jgi:sugar porter (SP) family MFS transporter